MSDDTEALSPEEQEIIDAGNREIAEQGAPQPRRLDQDPPSEGNQEERQRRNPGQFIAQQRRELREAKAALQTEREARIAYEARVQERLDRMERGRQQQTPQVTFDEDPKNYVEGKFAKVNETLDKFQAREREQSDAQQRFMTENQELGSVSEDEAEFRRSTPDYDKAWAQIVNTRQAELRALGVPDNQVANYIRQDALTIIRAAKTAGRSAPEIVYQMAQARGYRPAARQDGDESGVPSLDAEAERIARLKEGRQFAAPSGGNGGAPSSPGRLTAKQIDEMSEEDFSKWMTTKAGKAAFGNPN